jgi:hypothetical protein
MIDGLNLALFLLTTSEISRVSKLIFRNENYKLQACMLNIINFSKVFLYTFISSFYDFNIMVRKWWTNRKPQLKW